VTSVGGLFVFANRFDFEFGEGLLFSGFTEVLVFTVAYIFTRIMAEEFLNLFEFAFIDYYY